MAISEEPIRDISDNRFNWNCPYCSYIAKHSCYYRTPAKIRLSNHISKKHMQLHFYFVWRLELIKAKKRTDYEFLGVIYKLITQK